MSSVRLDGRDQAIDVVRGACVLVMTFAHLAPLTIVNRLLHLPLWIDGASGFVLLSGLVLGMVQHGRIRRGGLPGAQRALARRALLLYGWHVGIVLLAVLIGSVTGTRAAWLPDADDHGGPVGAVVRTLLLQLNPPYLDILSLYVVLFGFAMVALFLLHRGRVVWLAVASGAVYMGAQAAPGATTLGAWTGSASQFSWGAWQLLFLSGFVAGWYWRSAGLAARVTSGRVLLAAASVAAVIYLACIPVVYGGQVPAMHDGAVALVEKGRAGPGWTALAWAAFVIAYAVVSRLLSRVPAGWFAPLSTLGRRSLDCYVLLTLLVVLVPVMAGGVVQGGTAVAWATGAIAAMCAWVWLRDRLVDLRGRRSAAAPRSTEADLAAPSTAGNAAPAEIRP